MATKGKDLLAASSFWARIGIIVFLGGIFSMTSVEAAVTVQSFSGSVKVLLKDEDTWKPLPEKIELNAGDQILTEKGGSVDLVCEGGSTLHLDESTQLAISELEFSKLEQTRVSRFKLFWGALTAKSAKLEFTKNVFEVETDTVVAGFKFSSMKIIAKQTETLEDKPYTKLLPIEGKFEMRQTNEGVNEVECLLENARGGIGFSMGAKVEVELEVDQTRGNEKITVKSNLTLRTMRALLSDDRNLLHIENAIKAPVIEVGFQKYIVKIEQDSAATLGFPFGQAEQEIGVGAEGINAVFTFSQRADLPADQAQIFSDQGTIRVNGQELKPGSSTSFPIEVQSPTTEEPAPATGTQEVPVAPPAPERPPREGTGSPIQPK